jgi:hypothetical protein
MEKNMGATSVTGVSGPGESNGKYKPDNNCGCGCGKKDEDEPQEKIKLGCYVKHQTQGFSGYNSCTNSVNIKVC